jgi:hypothetical protein
MFRPFSGWAIIRLRPEYRRKLIYTYYNVDIKNGGTRPRFTIFGEVRSFFFCWAPVASATRCTAAVGLLYEARL